jgi:hypothetical protein
MNQSHNNRRRFELFVSLIVIAIIALVALGRYNAMAEDARIMRMEILSHHFLTGAANIRVRFLMESVARGSSSNQALTIIDDRAVYFSPQGWPASLQGTVSDDFQPSEEDCYLLWQVFMQNPPPITKGGKAKPRGDFRSLVYNGACRYQLLEGDVYFDYFPLTGQLMFASKAF